METCRLCKMNFRDIWGKKGICPECILYCMATDMIEPRTETLSSVYATRCVPQLGCAVYYPESGLLYKEIYHTGQLITLRCAIPRTMFKNPVLYLQFEN